MKPGVEWAEIASVFSVIVTTNTLIVILTYYRTALEKQRTAELRAKNLAVFARFSVRKVVTNCPGCYHTLKHDYGLEAYHASQLLAPERLPTGDDAGELTYHDPCHLANLQNVRSQPRRLLARSLW